MGVLDKLLQRLDYEYVHANDDERRRVHRALFSRLKEGKPKPFADLALAIDDPFGNFSAHEHSLGPMILASCRPDRIVELAKELLKCSKCIDVPDLIRNADISYLKIGVGSELGCLLRPKEFWVTNVRTIWGHLVVKHDGSVNKANRELALYRDSERDSEMEYAIWGALHRELEPSMRALAEGGSVAAQSVGLVGPGVDYLWADSVANALYEKRETL